MIPQKKNEVGLSDIDETGFPVMSLSELRERIASTIYEPPCFIEYERKNGFCWFEGGEFSATIGVAVALNGYEPLTEECMDRGYRAELLGWEWSYLMHFEMAINNLFNGDIAAYNFTGYFPRIVDKWIPKINESNWYLVYKAMS